MRASYSGLAIVAAAVAIGGWQRWGQAQDPCSSIGGRIEGSALAELAYRHDQQLEALRASHDLSRSSRLAVAPMTQQAPIIAASADQFASAATALASQQRAELAAACRRMTP